VNQLHKVAKPPLIPGFGWIRLLGSGGLADVHLYHQEIPSRDVAVKVLRTADDALAEAGLAREANALAKVSGHPAVVALHSVGEALDQRRYLVMEYCPVANIHEQVRAQPMAVAQAVEIMIGICGGVEMLHRAGLVHGDIKPSNIMLTSYGRPVLGDFGLATAIGVQVPRGGTGFSVFWAPPEQQVSQAQAHATQDVWALAATLWTLLAGRAPFEDPAGGNSTAAVAARVQAGRIPGLGRADVPPALEAVLAKAMTFDPLRRTQSAQQLGQELQEVQHLMHLPLTQMELRDQTVGVGPVSVDTGRTRVTSVPTLAAEPTRVPIQEFSFHTRDVPAAFGQEPVESAPASQSAAVQPAAVQPDASPARPARSKTTTYLLLAVVAVFACAGLITFMLTSNGNQIKIQTQSTQQAQPADPIGEAPAPVDELEGKLLDGVVYWSWSHDLPKGTHYLYVITAGNYQDTDTTRVAAVDTEAIAGTRMCLEVKVVSPDGWSSLAKRNCLEIPD
jgi:serine/threonine protein kinase